jgi:succinate dehydrogenase / fumarate reductase membrane anchor subunit
MTTRSKPGSAESKRWLFMRGSGFMMSSLVLGHLVIQHLLNDVHDLRVEWVAERWSKTGWRIWDGLMLILAVKHGLNGTRHVIDDTIHDPALNETVNWAVQILGMVLIAAGLIGLIAFDRDSVLEQLEE